MKEVYSQAANLASPALRAALLLLAVELAVACLLSDAALHSERLLLRSVAVLLFAALLLPFPGNSQHSGLGLAASWSAISALTLLAGISFSGGIALAFTREVLMLTVGILLLVGLFSGSTFAVAQWLGDRRAAAHTVLGTLLLSLTVPLWLSPLVALFGATRWLVDTVIALCPVSYLAALADIDYLRSDWFYQHTPYGGLRYDYPNAVYLSIGILLSLAALLALARSREPQIALSHPMKAPELHP